MSLIQNLPPASAQISAWARETTLDLKASLLEPREFATVIPRPDLSVKRPIRRAGSPSLTSLEIGSKRRERRESRWGTRRIRWEEWGEEDEGAMTTIGIWGVAEFASVPAERLLLSICDKPDEFGCVPGLLSTANVRLLSLLFGLGEGGWGIGGRGGESRS